jgi:hypothetical protein
MNWYTARCLFRSVHLGKPKRRRQLIEYRYILVKASGDKTATIRARQLAKKEEHSYRNLHGVKVKWVLERVLEVTEILAREIAEGTEVYHQYAYRLVRGTKNGARNRKQRIVL